MIARNIIYLNRKHHSSEHHYLDFLWIKASGTRILNDTIVNFSTHHDKIKIIAEKFAGVTMRSTKSPPNFIDPQISYGQQASMQAATPPNFIREQAIRAMRSTKSPPREKKRSCCCSTQLLGQALRRVWILQQLQWGSNRWRY